MGWLNDLYLTYESNSDEIGVIREGEPILLPIAHSTQNAHIEILLDHLGNFLGAKKLEKSEAVTVIPVTEDSGSRSGSAAFPHPLADKLEYLAGDYGKYTKKYNPEKFTKYEEQLKMWTTSSYATEEIRSVYTYIQKKSVVQDLIRDGLASVENGILTGEKVQNTLPLDWFVRFSVEIPGKEEIRLYCNREVFDSYVQYYLSIQKDNTLCYATGKLLPCSEKHPAKIRNTADKAKLISANDTSGFTYRGRFYNSNQAAQVSYEVSQKAHNALRWLIAKQSVLRVGEQVILLWSIQNPELQAPWNEFFFDDTEEEYTDETYAKQVRSLIWGNRRKLEPTDDVIVMGVEAATVGRLSITFYQKYNINEFFDYILKWKKDICWMKKWYQNSEPTPWSPSLYNIVKQAVGDKNDKLVKSTRERLMPCIIEGRNIPYDMVSNVVRAAINRSHYDKHYEWNDAIITACAVLRKYEIQTKGQKGVFDMVLDKDNLDRSYLFGRWIATAEMLEYYAMDARKDKVYRNTSAENYFVRFQRYPVQTMEIIRKKLQPYIMKLKKSNIKSDFYVRQLIEIESKLDYSEKGKLEPQFLQGYSCQYAEYQQYISKKMNLKEEENEYEDIYEQN